MQIPSRKTEEKDLYSTTKRGEGERQFQQFNKVWQDEASRFAAKIIKQGSDADPLIHDPLSGQRSLVLNAWIEASLGNVFLTKTSRHSSFVIAGKGSQELPFVICIKATTIRMTTRIGGLDGEVAELAKMLGAIGRF